VLSGFTLTNGWTDESGGGAWCDQQGTITNCVIIGNTASPYGGGVWYGNLYNCVLDGNYAAYQGGGVSDATVHNCVLTRNSAGTEGGAAAFSYLYNCTLTGNSAVQAGGAAGGRLYNCIAWFNTARSNPNFGTAYDYTWDENFPALLCFCCTTPAPPTESKTLLQTRNWPQEVIFPRCRLALAWGRP
jgi:hypothetical protein